jgi:hypothetical protein
MRRRLLAFCLLAGSIAALWLSYAPLRDYRESHHPNRPKYEHPTSDSFAVLVSTIETHHDLWIILETLALVFFTGTLWWSTRQLQMTMLGTPKLVRA